MEEITLTGMHAAAEELKSLREQKEAAEAIVSQISAKFEEKKAEFLQLIETQNGGKAFKAKCGITLTKSERLTVTLPKTPEDLAAFHQYLKEKGHDEIRTVNYQRLQGFYNEQYERAIEDKLEFFAIPGIENPKIHTTIKMIKEKKS